MRVKKNYLCALKTRKTENEGKEEPFICPENSETLE